MKKNLFAVFLCVGMLLIAGNVSAGLYTWVDTVDLNRKVDWFASSPYSHDLTDNTPPFEPLNDLIYDYKLTLSMHDDGGMFDMGEIAFLNQPGVLGDGFYDFSLTSQNFGWSVLGLVELNLTGILSVTIDSWFGDFYLDSSTLTAKGYDNAPVPEPATMLLLGIGLAGIAGFGRKKFFKKQA